MTNAVALAQGASNNVTFRNRLINSAMVIDQRNAGATGTGTGVYTVDRWFYFGSQNSKVTWGQNLNSITPPVGYTKYMGIQSSSAYSILAGDTFGFGQNIEGYNTADLAWGTANAKTITVSAWVYSSLTGSFGGFLKNNAGNRFYPFTYSIPTANTWTQISFIVAGDTSGTWDTTNNIGIGVYFTLGIGSTYSGTANVWTSSTVLAPTGSVSVVGTSGATFYITGVQLEAGTTASPFEYRQYGTELALCQRYYWKIKGSDGNYACFSSGLSTTGTTARHWLSYPAPMRTAPTISYGGTIYCYDGGNLVVTSISVLSGLQGALIDFTGSGGGATSGRGSVGNPATAASDFIQATAEL